MFLNSCLNNKMVSAQFMFYNMRRHPLYAFRPGSRLFGKGLKLVDGVSAAIGQPRRNCDLLTVSSLMRVFHEPF